MTVKFHKEKTTSRFVHCTQCVTLVYLLVVFSSCFYVRSLLRESAKKKQLEPATWVFEDAAPRQDIHSGLVYSLALPTCQLPVAQLVQALLSCFASLTHSVTASLAFDFVDIERSQNSHSQREFRSSNNCLKYRVLECGNEIFIKKTR